MQCTTMFCTTTLHYKSAEKTPLNIKNYIIYLSLKSSQLVLMLRESYQDGDCVFYCTLKSIFNKDTCKQLVCKNCAVRLAIPILRFIHKNTLVCPPCLRLQVLPHTDVCSAGSGQGLSWFSMLSVQNQNIHTTEYTYSKLSSSAI